MNHRTLVLAILDVRSSYLQERQEPAERETPDTVQWWVGPDATWLIKTFGIDHDLHLHHVTGGDAESYAEHTRQDYGDKIRAMYTLDFPDYQDADAVAEVLRQAGLRPDLEISEQHGFAFWNPDRGIYRTQSYPEK
ncbi:MAG TPA: hypothetical protein VFA04_02040 [Bryobacteraceae bacterium]|nr:hypothetical protein [Bryobacteraceae bacterium]